jgi:hypothetical protein
MRPGGYREERYGQDQLARQQPGGERCEHAPGDNRPGGNRELEYVIVGMRPLRPGGNREIPDGQRHVAPTITASPTMNLAREASGSVGGFGGFIWERPRIDERRPARRKTERYSRAARYLRNKGPATTGSGRTLSPQRGDRPGGNREGRAAHPRSGEDRELCDYGAVNGPAANREETARRVRQCPASQRPGGNRETGRAAGSATGRLGITRPGGNREMIRIAPGISIKYRPGGYRERSTCRARRS